ncbi:hypothetical protein BpHYR1_031303 [Brachionus plicatilis]|uniref:Uncharacterized protein n=1 Tax=Brachionus plicatilis TaxID=10195 RepID=A0A3M7T7H7_BRAPC|nr:hypothetical protein BpHYR1_031303 [Brachionus plicatilis]
MCNKISPPALKRLSGTKDCSLFALGYSLALAIDIDSGKLVFDQNKIRINERSEVLRMKFLLIPMCSCQENELINKSRCMLNVYVSISKRLTSEIRDKYKNIDI